MGESSKLTLIELREKVSAICGTLERELLPSPTLALGIPKGAIIELTGNSKTEWLIEFFHANPSLKVCWLEESFTLLPTALEQRGVNLDRVLFVECKTALFKPLRRVLQSKIFECIVVPSIFEEERELKALQLFAEKSNVALFLLGKAPKKSWPISVQLKVTGKKDELSVSVLKYKTTKVQS